MINFTDKIGPLDATNHDHLKELALRVFVCMNDRQALVRFLLDEGLMVTLEEPIPLPPYTNEFISSMAVSTVEHIILGKDFEDAHSVGGFSQREINKLVDFLNTLAS